MGRWTLVVIRHRKAIIAAWIALFLVGGAAAANLGGLLSNRFSVPGSDAERGLTLLKDHMHERSDGAFTLVVQGEGRARPIARAVAAAAQRAARRDPGRPRGHDPAGEPHRRLCPDLDAAREPGRVQADAEAAQGDRDDSRRDDLSDRLSPRSTTTPQPIYNSDLSKGESIAVPVALLVLAFMFGTLGAIVVPLALRARHASR